MARPLKTKLDYFPADVDIFQDRNIKRLRRKFPEYGFTIYFYALTSIYRDKGYFYVWEKDSAFDFAYDLNIEELDVDEIIKYCLELGLFDAKKFEEYSILTSRSIQQRWLKIVVESRRSETMIDKRYLLMHEKNELIPAKINKIPEKTSKTPLIPVKTNKIPEETQQSKVKESKVKESKVKESKVKETKEKKIDLYASLDSSNSQHSDSEKPLRAPPTKGEFMNYCTLHGFNPQYAEHLFDTCSAHGWLAQKTRAPIADWKAYARSRFKWQPGFLASLNQKKGFKSNKPQKPPSKFDSAEAFLEGIEIN